MAKRALVAMAFTVALWAASAAVAGAQAPPDRFDSFGDDYPEQAGEPGMSTEVFGFIVIGVLVVIAYGFYGKNAKRP